MEEKKKEKEIEPKFNVSEEGILSFLTLPPEEKEVVIPGTLDKTLSVLNKLKVEQDAEISLNFDFKGLPLASYVVINEALLEIFGPRVKALKEGFWGDNPPTRLSIKTGPDTQAQVFVGMLAPPPWKGGYISMKPNPKDHMSLLVNARIKRKYEPSVRRLIDNAKEKARQHSFYHGGAWDLDLDFIALIRMGHGYDPMVSAPKPIEDLDKTPTLILPRDIENRLIVNLWNVIEKPDDYRYNKVPVRNGVMLVGPSGTGKTLTMMHTIKRAIKAGFTVFQLLTPAWFVEAYKIAQFHSPSVLIAEDAEKFLGGPRDEALDAVLGILDGSSSKNSEVIVIASTNHPDQINPFVLREGRMGLTIEYRTLDAEAGSRLVEELAGKYLAPDIDLVKIGMEVDTLSASNVDGAIGYAKKLAIHEFGREIKGRITTQMLIDGADLIKQDKGLYKKGSISQAESDLLLIRGGRAAERGPVPKRVWHDIAEYVEQTYRKEKGARARETEEEPRDAAMIEDKS